MTIKILTIAIYVSISTVINDDNVRPYFSEGGWRTYPSDMVAMPGPCNIDIKDKTMSHKEFMSEYAKTKPFIVRDSAKNDLFKSLARK